MFSALRFSVAPDFNDFNEHISTGKIRSERVKEGIKAADNRHFPSNADMTRIFNKYENA